MLVLRITKEQLLRHLKADEAAETVADVIVIAEAAEVATVTVVAGVAEIATVVETAVDAVVEIEVLDRITGIVETDLREPKQLPSEKLQLPHQSP